MIVLDTNVISELMRRATDPQVMSWFAEQPAASLFTTTPLTQAEIFYGLALLPAGRRRDDLLAAARPMFDVDIAGRVLPFDADAALVYAEIAAGRKQGGKPISQIDAQIAAIARSRGARLATAKYAGLRRIKGVTVVDPWSGAYEAVRVPALAAFPQILSFTRNAGKIAGARTERKAVANY